MTAAGAPDPLVIAGRTFSSRLILGTGKYPSPEIMQAAHRAGGTEMVTVAVRRVDITRQSASLLDFIDTTAITLLPNTAGCYTADDAIRTAHLGREAGLSHWVKLEVIGDEATLFPDTAALVEATKVLVKDGFVVLPYTNDDPIVCRKLEDAGAVAVMPAGAPIGPGSASRTSPTCASSGNRRAYRSSSTPAWARPRTPPSPWSSAPTRCCSTRPSPGRAIRSRWPPP